MLEPSPPATDIEIRAILTVLGQPLEVVKTTMAANRSDGFSSAIGRIWQRGGVLGCEYIPYRIA